MKLAGKKVALFVANLYEDTEFWYPYFRMKEEGAEVVVIGPEEGIFQSKHGVPAKPARAVEDLVPADFQALIIPGGYSPDHMRRSPPMVAFVRRMAEEGKVVAAICHGPWMLASAKVVRGKRVTSFSSIRDDLEHAGARWVDEEVVRDGNLITSRTPDDLPAFSREILQALAGP
jgi:protease I